MMPRSVRSAELAIPRFEFFQPFFELNDAAQFFEARALFFELFDPRCFHWKCLPRFAPERGPTGSSHADPSFCRRPRRPARLTINVASGKNPLNQRSIERSVSDRSGLKVRLSSFSNRSILVARAGSARRICAYRFLFIANSPSARAAGRLDPTFAHVSHQNRNCRNAGAIAEENEARCASKVEVPGQRMIPGRPLFLCVERADDD